MQRLQGNSAGNWCSVTTVANCKTGRTLLEKHPKYIKYAGKAIQQKDQAFKWTWNMIIYFSHNFVFSNICCCKYQSWAAELSRECFFSWETVLCHTPGVHVAAAALSHQAHGCRWLLKNYDSVLCNYTDRELMHKEVKSRRLSLPVAWTSTSDFYVTLPQWQFPLISPSSDRPCAVTEEYHPLGDLGRRRSVGPRLSVQTGIVL